MGMAAFRLFTASRVEASAFLIIGRYTVRLPFTSAYAVVLSAPSVTVAMSRKNTVGPVTLRMGVFNNSSGPFTREFTGLIRFWSPMITFPAGDGVLFLAMAMVISSAERP